MTHIEHIESLVNQFGDDMDKAAWQQIKERLNNNEICPHYKLNVFGDGFCSQLVFKKGI